MKQHVNFYESINEARMRINNTVVLYDGQPYYVLLVSDHKPDGIFRVYLDPVGQEGGMECQTRTNLPTNTIISPNDNMGVLMDEWIDKNPGTTILRKKMNSPAFNRFRPFPLGMMNILNTVYYLERQPTRKVEQGLTNGMIVSYKLDVGSVQPTNMSDLTGVGMKDTILGLYPSAEECIEALTDPEVANKGAAFNRKFAFLRGPVNTLYLAYKNEVVGFLPNNDLSCVRLGRAFTHTKEAVAELNIFREINQ